LTNGIPLGNGPDLFIYAHERLGGWALSGFLEPVGADAEDTLVECFDETIAPLRFEGKLYGLPLAFKSLALFYRTDLLRAAWISTDQLLADGPALLERGVFPLAYTADKFYSHAPWYFGFGGELLRPDGSVGFDGDGA